MIGICPKAGYHLFKNCQLLGLNGGQIQSRSTIEKNPWSKEVLVGADNGTLGTASKVALYTADAGLGLVAGLFGTRAINYRMEFRADQYSKALMGGEAMAASLGKLARSFARLQNTYVSRNATDLEVARAVDRSRTFLQKLLYPPIEQRIEVLTR